MKLRVAVGSILFLLIGSTVSLADVRNTVSGADGAFFLAARDQGSSIIRVFRNGVLTTSPSTSLIVGSEPAMTRAGSTLYIVVRGSNGGIYCTTSAFPYILHAGKNCAFAKS